jgi:hypothetical protein
MIELARTWLGLLSLTGLLFGGTALAEEPPRSSLLWHTIAVPNTGGQSTPPKYSWLLREQEIAFEWSLLQIVKDAAARPLPPLAVEFFDAGRYDLDVVSTVSRINDTSLVRGQLKPPGQGDFSLVINGATVTGTMQLGRRVFKIESLGNGRHRLIEIDPEQESKE